MKNGFFPEDKLKKENTQMRSVWSLPSPKNSEKEQGRHPTQKPLDLLNRIVLASTNENDTVLDPFCGSGTTALACAINKRKFIGVEIETDYCEIVKKRLDKILK